MDKDCGRIGDLHKQRRSGDNKTDDQDHEHRRPVGRVREAEIESAICATRIEAEQPLKGGAFAAAGATTL